MIKRILIVVAATAVAILGFTLWQKSQAENPHADEHEQEEHVDVENILLNEKQIKAVDLKWGNVSCSKHRNGYLTDGWRGEEYLREGRTASR